MKRLIAFLVVAALVITVYSGCKKPETFPIIPAIEFKSIGSYKNISGKDSVTVITISFTDGDGDIGYAPAGNGPVFDDTSSAYYYNFIVHFYEKKNGVWVRDTVFDRPPFSGFSGRLPNLTPRGENKALKGDISMDQYISFYPVQNDTIKYEVYIYDRALHKSNTVMTSEIVITTF